MFYTFMQNNSGGNFHVDPARGISTAMIIEATDPLHANDIAARLGLYFGGVSGGSDCSCCGDRWYPVEDSDGYPTPSYYGLPLVEAKCYSYFSDEVPILFVHLLDGTVIPFHAYDQRLVYLGNDLPVGILGSSDE